MAPWGPLLQQMARKLFRSQAPRLASRTMARLGAMAAGLGAAGAAGSAGAGAAASGAAASGATASAAGGAAGASHLARTGSE